MLPSKSFDLVEDRGVVEYPLLVRFVGVEARVKRHGLRGPVPKSQTTLSVHPQSGSSSSLPALLREALRSGMVAPGSDQVAARGEEHLRAT